VLSSQIYVCIVLCLAPPLAPRSLHVAKETTSTVTLEWAEPSSDGGNPLKAYIIEVKLSKDTDFQSVGKVDGKTCSFTAEQLSPDTEYEFRVLAENEAGQSLEAAELESPVWLKAKASEFPRLIKNICSFVLSVIINTIFCVCLYV
jgi:titin